MSEFAKKAFKYAQDILKEVESANLSVSEDAKKWATEAGVNIAKAEENLEEALKENDSFLIKKWKQILENLAFESTELVEIEKLIRDKSLIIILKKGAKTVASGVISFLLAAG